MRDWLCFWGVVLFSNKWPLVHDAIQLDLHLAYCLHGNLLNSIVCPTFNWAGQPGDLRDETFNFSFVRWNLFVWASLSESLLGSGILVWTLVDVLFPKIWHSLARWLLKKLWVPAASNRGRQVLWIFNWFFRFHLNHPWSRKVDYPGWHG